MTDTAKTTETKAEPKAEIDELEKIMSEIEELQNELEETTTAPAAAGATVTAISVEIIGASGVPESASEKPTALESDDILKEIQANAMVDESNMEETLAELKSEDTGSSLLSDVSEETTAETETFMSSNTGENSNSNSNPGSGSEGTLSMTLTGNMTLKLRYEFEGQEVTISFADQALRVQMTDGTEFKVPVGRATQAPSNVKPFKKTG